MRLPYDTTVHYIAVHLHPFAESLELRDLSPGETLFKSAARNFDGRIGLSHVDYFASEEGNIAVVKAGDDWEVLAVNSLDEPIYGTPALSQGHIYVRTDAALYSFSSRP